MFDNPFSFKGRIGRKEYAISYIFYIISFLWGGVTMVFHDMESLNDLLPFVPLYWFLLAQSVKRCHDMGHSGLSILIPFYSFWLFLGEGDKGKNLYGKDPRMNLEEDELLEEDYFY